MYICMWVLLPVCVCVRVRACVRACVCVMRWIWRSCSTSGRYSLSDRLTRALVFAQSTAGEHKEPDHDGWSWTQQIDSHGRGAKSCTIPASGVNIVYVVPSVCVCVYRMLNGALFLSNKNAE